MVDLAEGLFTRRSVSLTGAAVFGGLAALSTVIVPARIQPPYPIMPFLRFDPAELFSVLAFLIFGPIPAMVAATVHWIFLTATGTNGPLGPAVKFISVLSMLLGLWVGSKIYSRVASTYRYMSVAVGSMLVSAMLFRVAILLPVNYFVFTYIGPVIFGINYINGSQQALQTTLGLHFAGLDQIVAAMLLYTSVFNALHAVFSVMIPYALFTPLSMKVPEIASGHPWISRFMNNR